MDLTVTVNRMRELVPLIQEECWNHGCSIEIKALEFVHHFEALDSWLSKNGFLPEQWKYKDK